MARPFLPQDLFNKYIDPYRENLTRELGGAEKAQSILARSTYMLSPSDNELLNQAVDRAILGTTFDKESLLAELEREIVRYENMGKDTAPLKSAAQMIKASSGRVMDLLSLGYASAGLTMRDPDKFMAYNAYVGLAQKFTYFGGANRAIARLALGQSRGLRRGGMMISFEEKAYGPDSDVEIGETIAGGVDPEKRMIAKQEFIEAFMQKYRADYETAEQIADIYLSGEGTSNVESVLEQTNSPVISGNSFQNIVRGIKQLSSQDRIYLPVYSTGGQSHYMSPKGKPGGKDIYRGWHTAAELTQGVQVSISKRGAMDILNIYNLMQGDINKPDTVSNLRELFLGYAPSGEAAQALKDVSDINLVSTFREYRPKMFSEEGWEFLDELVQAHLEERSKIERQGNSGGPIKYSIAKRREKPTVGNIVYAKIKAIQEAGYDLGASMHISFDIGTDTSRSIEIERTQAIDYTLRAPSDMPSYEVYRRAEFFGDEEGGSFRIGALAPEIVPEEHTFVGYAATAAKILEGVYATPAISRVFQLADIIRNERHDYSIDDVEMLSTTIRSIGSSISNAIGVDIEYTFGDLYGKPVREMSQREIKQYGRSARDVLRLYSKYLFSRKKNTGFETEEVAYLDALNRYATETITSYTTTVRKIEEKPFRLVLSEHDEKTGEDIYRVVPTTAKIVKPVRDVDYYQFVSTGEEPEFTGYPVERLEQAETPSSQPLPPSPERSRFDELFSTSFAGKLTPVEEIASSYGISDYQRVASDIKKTVSRILTGQAPISAIRRMSPIQKAIIGKQIYKEWARVRDLFSGKTELSKRLFAAFEGMSTKQQDFVLSGIKQYNIMEDALFYLKDAYDEELERIDINKALVSRDPVKERAFEALLRQSQGEFLQEVEQGTTSAELSKLALEREQELVSKMFKPGEVGVFFDIETYAMGWSGKPDEDVMLRELAWVTARLGDNGQFEILEEFNKKFERPLTNKKELFNVILMSDEFDKVAEILGVRPEEIGNVSFGELVRAAKQAGLSEAYEPWLAFEKNTAAIKVLMNRAKEVSFISGYNIREFDIQMLRQIVHDFGKDTSIFEGIDEKTRDLLPILRNFFGFGKNALADIAIEMSKNLPKYFSGQVLTNLQNLIKEKVERSFLEQDSEDIDNNIRHAAIEDARTSLAAFIYMKAKMTDVLSEREAFVDEKIVTAREEIRPEDISRARRRLEEKQMQKEAERMENEANAPPHLKKIDEKWEQIGRAKLGRWYQALADEEARKKKPNIGKIAKGALAIGGIAVGGALLSDLFPDAFGQIADFLNPDGGALFSLSGIKAAVLLAAAVIPFGDLFDRLRSFSARIAGGVRGVLGFSRSGLDQSGDEQAQQQLPQQLTQPPEQQAQPPAQQQPVQPQPIEQPQQQAQPPQQTQAAQPVSRFDPYQFMSRFNIQDNRGRTPLDAYRQSYLSLLQSLDDDQANTLRPSADYGKHFVEGSNYGFRGKRSIEEAKVSAITGEGQITSSFNIAEEAVRGAICMQVYSKDPLAFKTDFERRVMGTINEKINDYLKALEESPNPLPPVRAFFAFCVMGFAFGWTIKALANQGWLTVVSYQFSVECCLDCLTENSERNTQNPKLPAQGHFFVLCSEWWVLRSLECRRVLPI